MPIFHTNFEQRSAEWYKMRRGVLTASNFDKIITPLGKPSKSDTTRKHMNKLLAEWALGADVEPEYKSHWMERGIELEDAAIRAFEFETDNETLPIGFVSHDYLPIGCSPDRIIAGEPSLLEIKCPSPVTHMGYLLDPDSLVSDYFVQVQGELYVCEYGAAALFSHCPGLPNVLKWVGQDERFQHALGHAIKEFSTTLLVHRDRLSAEYGVAA